MAETEAPSKRLRQDAETPDLEEESSTSNSKRHKPYTNATTILSLLDDQEAETQEHINQDLSAIFTTLEQELSSHPPPPAPEQTPEDDETVESVMRHLLEASDDELGIPNYSNNVNTGINSDQNISFNFFDNGLWEFDDVAANYYTILHSELLFM